MVERERARASIRTGSSHNITSQLERKGVQGHIYRIETDCTKYTVCPKSLVYLYVPT